MKIVQFYEDNIIKTGVLSWDSVFPFLFNGTTIDIIEKKIKPQVSEKSIPIENVNFAPVITGASKIIAIGLNYKDHAQELGLELPKNPLIFTKFTNSLLGHKEKITWNQTITNEVDFEAELAVIIGEKVYNCHNEDAMDCVYGYTCANDVSARDLQFSDVQWVRGKSLDSFCPIGPCIVTKDEIPEPDNLKIQCLLNNKIMQNSNTKNLIFNIKDLISFLSKHFTLFPGDIILTGTPGGVGTFREPPVYLKNNDEIIVRIEKIGSLVNYCKETSINNFPI